MNKKLPGHFLLSSFSVRMNDVDLEIKVANRKYRAQKQLRRAAKCIEQAITKLDALTCDYVARSDVEADLDIVDRVLHRVKFAVVHSKRARDHLKHIKACGAVVEN